MSLGQELGETVKARPSLLPRRLWRFLLAHDATSRTCDPLIIAVESALGDVDIVEATSVDHALAELGAATFDATLVCLDLPPAPVGGARLAHSILDEGGAVVLVTRSLRWLPPSDRALQRLPWVSPDAQANAVAKAVHAAVAQAESVAADAAPSSSGWRIRDDIRAASRR